MSLWNDSCRWASMCIGWWRLLTKVFKIQSYSLVGWNKLSITCILKCDGQWYFYWAGVVWLHAYSVKNKTYYQAILIHLLAFHTIKENKQVDLFFSPCVYKWEVKNYIYYLLLVCHLRTFKYGALNVLCIYPLLRGGLSQSQCLCLGCLESVQVWRYFLCFSSCL